MCNIIRQFKFNYKSSNPALLKVAHTDARLSTAGAEFKNSSLGFTLLELLVVIAIIAVMSFVALPDQTKKTKSLFNNLQNDIIAEVNTAREYAILQSKTTRSEISTDSAGIKTITNYITTTSTTTCDNSGTWTQLSHRVLKIPAGYLLSGSTRVCSYRDGSSSGGTITIAKDTLSTATNVGSAVINIISATGFADVTISAATN